jgi:peptidoglycan-N-acetylglucosamine deacetylase
MKDRPQSKPRFSLAHWSGLAALLLAVMLLAWDPRLAALPLMLFLLLCCAAPFLPGFGFFLAIISRGRPDCPAAAITFDDGPDPLSTPSLLALLEAHGAQATFFVTGQKAECYPDLVREIVSQGHTVGNHTYSHDNFIMFKSIKALVREIDAAQQVFRRLGFTPSAFRPPVGVTNPRLARALDQTGLYIVNFSKRAGDMGNRRIKHLSRRILKRLRPGDIIMLHDIPPRPTGRLGAWLEQVEQVLSGIEARGLAIRPLAELIDRPVMTMNNPDPPQ